jgi:hypothetical protein
MRTIDFDNSYNVLIPVQAKGIIYLGSLEPPESNPLLVSQMRYQLATVSFQGCLLNDIQDITSRVLRRSHSLMVRCVRSKLSTHSHKLLHIFRADYEEALQSVS